VVGLGIRAGKGCARGGCLDRRGVVLEGGVVGGGVGEVEVGLVADLDREQRVAEDLPRGPGLVGGARRVVLLEVDREDDLPAGGVGDRGEVL
jgi:hypothetical protein